MARSSAWTTTAQATTLYDAPELEVHALAAAPDGSLYGATSPDGQIYRIDPTGAAKPFFKPEEKYIWSLAVDAAGRVYAGTGEKGVIYRIAADGKGEVFYKTRSANVVALAFDAAGNLLAGTESPGRVFRIDREGKAFVLLESAFREIHALRVGGDGVIYAVAVAAKGGGTSDDRPAETAAAEPIKTAASASVSTEITGFAVIDVAGVRGPEGRRPPRRRPRGSRGAVYRIQPDGLWDIVWESADDTPYDVAFARGGGVLVATGPKGKIFKVDGDPPQVTLVGRAPAQQVTRFLSRSNGDTLLVTSNPGKLLRLSPGRAERGTYESDVRDSQTVSTWGAISWRGSTPPGSRIEIRTRSGNSETPDDTWSPWSDPYRNADGQAIQSPKARFLQWQAVLAGKEASPVLTSVTAAYLQRNLRPRVTGITVYPPGHVFQKPYSTGEAEIAGFDDVWPDTRPSPTALAAGSPSSAGGSPLGRRVFLKGLQAFSWKAEDDNDDKLQYDVLYRREGDTGWKALKRGLTDPLFVWDTVSVPRRHVRPEDRGQRCAVEPAGAGLSGEADSVAFDIDNTPPSIRVTGARRDGARTVIAFEAADAQSAIQRVDYSVEAGRWRPVAPADGICDSRLERFEIVVDGAASGVVLRVIDAMGNGDDGPRGGAGQDLDESGEGRHRASEHRDARPRRPLLVLELELRHLALHGQARIEPDHVHGNRHRGAGEAGRLEPRLRHEVEQRLDRLPLFLRRPLQRAVGLNQFDTGDAPVAIHDGVQQQCQVAFVEQRRRRERGAQRRARQNHRRIRHDRVLVVSRRRQNREQGNQVDDGDARHGGAGGAERRPHQVQILEEPAGPSTDGLGVLGLQAADDCRRQALQFLRPHLCRQCAGAETGADFLELAHLRCTRRAASEVRLDGNVRVDRQFAVLKRGQLAPNLPAGLRHHVLSASLSWLRSADRARVRRDFTVPTATSSENAISS